MMWGCGDGTACKVLYRHEDLSSHSQHTGERCMCRESAHNTGALKEGTGDSLGLILKQPNRISKFQASEILSQKHKVDGT